MGHSSAGQRSRLVMAGVSTQSLTMLKPMSQTVVSCPGLLRKNLLPSALRFWQNSFSRGCGLRSYWLLLVRGCFQLLEAAGSSLPGGPPWTVHYRIMLLGQQDWISLTSSSATCWRRCSALKEVRSNQDHFLFTIKPERITALPTLNRMGSYKGS